MFLSDIIRFDDSGFLAYPILRVNNLPIEVNIKKGIEYCSVRVIPTNQDGGYWKCFTVIHRGRR